MRTLLALAVGLAAGLAGGYFAFRGQDVAPRRDEVRTPAAAESPGEKPMAPRAEPETKRRARGPLVIRTTGGVTTTGDLVLVPEGEIVEPRGLETLRAALDEARARRDWDGFWQALLELAALGTPDAQRLLVEVMGDTTLNLQGTHIGQSFFRWLKGSDLAGILAAARARAEVELKDRPDSRWRGAGWLSLVALHGGGPELAWIDSLGSGRNWEMEVDRALAEGASNPHAARLLAERLQDPDHFLWGPYLESYAHENPAAAFEAAAAALSGPRTHQREELLRLLGEATTAETLPAARTLLNSFEGERGGLEALVVVNRLSRRGHPVGEFAEVIDLPRRIVAEYVERGEAPGSRADEVRLRGALNIMRGSEVTWTEETLALVRRLGDLSQGEIAKFAQKTANKMEQGLAAARQGWVPARDPGR